MEEVMILDAPTFNLVLTPEAALGIVQKELAHRGWKKMEVEEIRLIYSPYYIFSFDVHAEGSPPISGKAAINAYTGELSDFIPMLLERPLQKTKSTGEGAEVEESALSASEAKEAAKSKVAAQTGLKPEVVTVSAFSKVYVPFYRIWLEAAHNSQKFDVDALMGSPLGMEAVPEKPKSWDEATKETISKLKSPAGWVEMGGKAVGALFGKGGGPHGGGDAHGGGHADEHGGAPGGGGILEGKQGRWILLGGAILVMMYLLFGQSAAGVKCSGEIAEYKSGCILRGSCEFSAKKVEDIPLGKGAQIYVKDGNVERLDLQENAAYYGQTPVAYNITWKPEGKECRQYGWGYRVI